MDTSINGKTFELLLKEGTTTKIPATVSYDADIDPLTAALDPNEPLQAGVTYKAVVTTGAKDLASNPWTRAPPQLAHSSEPLPEWSALVGAEVVGDQVDKTSRDGPLDLLQHTSQERYVPLVHKK